MLQRRCNKNGMIMRSALRKMGNSTGMILPAPLLRAAGLGVGAELELAVEEGRIIATPVLKEVRTGWAEAAAAISLTEEDREWLGAPLASDAELEW
jgi:antitoxin MazE